MPDGRQPLTRQRILDAAIALADREGVEALSMRRIGAELGVQAMSLYRHVASKQDLLDGVAGTLLARMDIPLAGTTTWEDGLRQVCRAYRQLAQRHPGLFPLVLERPLASREVLPPLEATLTLLRRAGLDPQGALDAFRACASFVGGFALGEISRRDDRDEWPPLSTDEDRRRYPVTAEIASVASPDQDRAFETGLDLLTAGLRAHLAADRTAPGSSTGR